MGIYAVIKTGGKQYRVSPGDIVQVEKLAVRPGNTVEITDVFMLVNGGDVTIGDPTVPNTRIIAEVLEEGRGEKIRIFKKRRRKHYQKTMGHRQYYSAIRVNEIIQGKKSHKADTIEERVSDFDDRKQTPVLAAPIARVARPAPSAPQDGKANQNNCQQQEIGSRPSSVVPPSVSPPPSSSAETATLAPQSNVEKDSQPEVRSDVARPRFDERRVRTTPDAIGVGSEPILFSGDVTPAISAAPSHRPFTEHGAIAGSNADRFPRDRLYGLLAALLVLLIGGFGWLFSRDKEPAIDVNVAPKDQPMEQPPIREGKVHKPAPTSVPSAPAQPPD